MRVREDECSISHEVLNLPLDILTWFKQLAPDGYERNKRNAEHTLKKLQYLVSLLDEGLKRQ